VSECDCDPVAMKYEMKTALVMSLLIDLIGMLTYLLPIIGESLDVAWAPISMLLLQHMYGNWIISLIGGVEEASFGFDFIPTATIAWVIIYMLNSGGQASRQSPD
jgi:hypothetical protein